MTLQPNPLPTEARPPAPPAPPAATPESFAFKQVESLCGVARIAVSEAMAHASSLPEGEMREEAIETLQGTLTAILYMYNGKEES